jgi:hypothetical protein
MIFKIVAGRRQFPQQDEQRGLRHGHGEGGRGLQAGVKTPSQLLHDARVMAHVGSDAASTTPALC